MTRLAGQRAVITGGGRGIGAAIALAYAAEGAAVAVAGRSADRLAAVAGRIREAGGLAAAVVADVTSDQAVDALVGRATDALGGPATVLVNNAGRHLTRPFLAHSVADWERLFAVNVFGTVRVTRAFLPAMLTAGTGRIINISSTAGKWGTANQTGYNASKHALLGLTRSLALETAAAGVRVTAICPGWVDTELIDEAAFAPVLGVPPEQVRTTLAARSPIGRMATAQEVAALAVYLASPDADAVTGVGVTLAGGMLLI